MDDHSTLRAEGVGVGTRPPERSLAARTLLPVGAAVAALLLLDLAQRVWVGQPEAFWSVSAYRGSMDAVALARYTVILFSSLIVWPVMWLRGAPLRERVIGVIVVPTVFAVMSVISGLTFFPPAQALFYGTNPIVAGSFGAQVASAAIGGTYARWRWRRRSGSPLRVVTPGAVLALVLGAAVPIVSIGWDGGIHWFYPWTRVYIALFGTGV